jgi:hypothetical protein
MTTTLLMQIDGEAVPINHVSWEAVGGCGCVFGWHTAAHGSTIYAATEDDAKKELFGGTKVERKYYEDAGCTVRAVANSSITHVPCEHSPRFGLPDADAPEGHEWATTDRWWEGRQTHMRHIVPSLPTGDAYEDHEANRATVSRCGKAPTRHNLWHTDATSKVTDVKSKVPCSKCLKAVAR